MQLKIPFVGFSPFLPDSVTVTKKTKPNNQTSSRTIIFNNTPKLELLQLELG